MHNLKTTLLKIGNFKIKKTKEHVKIINKTNTHGFLVIPKIYKYDNKDKRICLKGKLISGNAPIIKLINRWRTTLYSFEFNTENIISNSNFFIKYFFIVVYVPENSEFTITELTFDNEVEKVYKKIDTNLKNDILIVTPGYPSESNAYNTAFVHSRVKEYKKNGVNVDLLCINGLPGLSIYDFDGINVTKGDYYFLRKVLSYKKYKKIAIHFFDHNYGNVLDAIDISNTEIYLFTHGADVLYRAYKDYASPYFGKKLDISDKENEFKLNDYYIEKYNNIKNVKWIFISDFIKNKLENLLNIKINNYKIIPNYVDTDFFSYSKKSNDKRKKIFILRKFTNDFCYALDIDMKIILELSKRKNFEELEFDIYGSGEMFDILTEPVKKFNNVHLHRTFLTHDEIKEVHDSHGIALFASRFDTQGVSLCEAISSGCGIVTSKLEVLNSFIDEKLNITCDVENYKEYADVVEKLITDEKYFNNVVQQNLQSVKEKFGYDKTILKEIKLFKENKNHNLVIKDIKKEPILSVIIPAYNVEKYLWNGVITLLNQKNSNKIEILIINDGSSDNTASIGKKLENKYPNVKLITKENGGHGSTINLGMKFAKGKYVKIMDGDDTVDSIELCKLITLLEKTNADVVLNNYIEDYYLDNIINFKNVYPMLVPGVVYNFDDLCYDGYGFDNWGPILSCSTYKNEFLKKIDFKLTENCFYVDMELNNYISSNCQSIVYYPLNVYRYLLGRKGQSVSKESYMKNYKQHEKVIFNIINYYYSNENNMSEIRKQFIMKKIILTMIITQYIITVQYYNNRKPFKNFDKKLKKYPEIYNNEIIATRAIKFHRLTNGLLIFMNSFLVKTKRLFIKGENKNDEES